MGGKRKISEEEFARILEEHRRWMETEGVEGSRANLSDADLNHLDFRGVQLQGAIIRNSNLSRAALSDVILSYGTLCFSNFNDTDMGYADLNYADCHGSTFVDADLRSTGLCNSHLNGADLSFADLYMARLGGADLRGADFEAASLIDADLSGAEISGVKLYKANISRWKITGIRCTHIIQHEERIDFAPGEFEKKYTWLESVAEVMLRLPLSDLTLYAGPLMAQAVNQAHGEAAVQFKGVEALSDDTTSLKFVLFSEAERTREALAQMEQRLNEQAEELKKLVAPSDEQPPILTLPDRMQLPGLPWLSVDTKALELAQTKWYVSLPEGLQRLWQIVQDAIKP